MACRKWWLHQVERKGDERQLNELIEKATGEGTSLSLEQNGSELQHNPGFWREAFCFCCNGSAPATMLVC